MSHITTKIDSHNYNMTFTLYALDIDVHSSLLDLMSYKLEKDLNTLIATHEAQAQQHFIALVLCRC